MSHANIRLPRIHSPLIAGFGLLAGSLAGCQASYHSGEVKSARSADRLTVGTVQREIKVRLMMPSKLLKPIINRDIGDLPDLGDIRKTAGKFQVSLTSMMVRWTRLSDFPCAVFSVSDIGGKTGIRWGWVSEAFVQVGAYWRLYGEFRSKDAKRFLGSVPDLTRWRSGSGIGMMNDWVETDHRISVKEHYAVIPYANHLLVFLTATEDDLIDCRPDWDD